MNNILRSTFHRQSSSHSMDPSRQQQQRQRQQQNEHDRHHHPLSSDSSSAIAAARPSQRRDAEQQRVQQEPQRSASRPASASVGGVAGKTDYDMMLMSSSSSSSNASDSTARRYVPPAVASTLTSTAKTAPKSSAATDVGGSGDFTRPPAATAVAAKAAWRTAVCPRTHKTYYWNTVTRESRWKKPLELASEEEVEQILAKERELREFFDEMERNVLRRYAMGDYYDRAKERRGEGERGGEESDATEIIIDQSWMVAADSPTESICEDEGWIARWITPNSESSDAASPVGGVDMDALRGSTPVSVDDGHSLGSDSAGSRDREERDDRNRPLLLPAVGNGQQKMSKLERIKSSGSVIDKPDLIRTISKMEDVLLARQLNPLPTRVELLGQRAMAEFDSPRTVPGRDDDGLMSPITPTSDACDILSSLHLSLEAEGLIASVVSMFTTSQMTPVSDDGSNDGVSLDLPTTTSSPNSEASASSSISVAIVKPSLIKSNTYGTVYLGSTLSAPDKEALIKCVCGVFRAHMLSSSAEPRVGEPVRSDSTCYSTISSSTSSSFRDDADEHAIFKDRRSPGDYRPLDTSSIPALSVVTDYYRSIFLRSQMETECIIISLIYVERLVKMTNGKLSPRPENWRSVLFSCMVLASKVWDDLSMWNCDFSKIGPLGMTFTLARTNQLEIELLRTLRYRVKVESSEYAKYYFLLRCMLSRSGLTNDDLASLRPATETGVALCATTKPMMKERSKTHGCIIPADQGQFVDRSQ
jgi:hypothetical protein